MNTLRWVLVALLLGGCVDRPAANPSPTADTGPTATQTPLQPSPTDTVAATPACLEGEGTWQDAEYPAVAASGMIPVQVYLPHCHLDPENRYPVAYFLHGKPYTERQWLDLGLQELVAVAANEPGSLPMILVLARQPEPLFSNSDGGPGSYETEFIGGLVAWVDRTYHTDPTPGRRAVVGISRGGIWALEVAMTHPDVVETVVALSPSLAVNYARPAYDPIRLAQTAPALPPNILLAAGETDWARAQTEALSQTLSARGISHGLRVVSGGHLGTTWQTLLPEVLGYLVNCLT